ncbi:MAG: sulfide-dependent adenosine diphosphate thiazole synthase [Thermoproteus sp.]|jgi:thiazole-adenylate synthase|nr:MAG: ribulose-1,5-biphosphate synthetase [Thermoproteus sp. CIS_19]
MELKIGRAIVRHGAEELYEYSDVDVAIVGAGPSGLTAARYLAEKGLKVIVLERRFSFGGGIGPGGNMFPKIIVQEEALPILRDFKVGYKPAGDGLYAVDPAELIAKLAVGAIDAGAKILLGVHVDDVIFRGNPPRIAGLLWIWTPIQMSGMHVDPLYMQAKAVVDATGHDAEVVSVAARKVPELGIQLQGEKSAWSEVSEKLVVEHTGRVAPGLYVAGMAVAAVFGLPRMGPIFGGMLMSGRRIAEIVAEEIGKAQYAV